MNQVQLIDQILYSMLHFTVFFIFSLIALQFVTKRSNKRLWFYLSVWLLITLSSVAIILFNDEYIFMAFLPVMMASIYIQQFNQKKIKNKGKKPKSVLLALLACLIVLGLFAVSIRAYFVKNLEEQFVEEVLLGLGSDPKVNVIFRWTKSLVLIGLHGENPEDIKNIEKFIQEINQTIEGSGVSLRLKLAEEASAEDIQIHFIPYKDFLNTSRKLGLDYDPNKYTNTYFQNSNDNYELGQTVLLIDADYSEQWRIKAVSHMMSRAIGPYYVSELFSNSIFNDKFELFNRDKKLLQFLYLYLKPGDTRSELKQAFDEHW